MVFKVIDRCPVPAELYEELVEIKSETGVTYNSIDRSPEAESLLHKNGKKSQKELYECWRNRTPGCNPANPPGFSTHERRNDGVAYDVPRGAKLDYWQVGIDSTNSRSIIGESKRRGWVCTLTYPSSPVEGHHVNFRKEPVAFEAIKLNDRGPRVKELTTLLRDIRDPIRWVRYLPHRYVTFSPIVQDAVKKFQHDHNQKIDGIVGSNTWEQLLVANRRQDQLLSFLVPHEREDVELLLELRDVGKGNFLDAHDIEDRIRSQWLKEIRIAVEETGWEPNHRRARYNVLKAIQGDFS